MFGAGTGTLTPARLLLAGLPGLIFLIRSRVRLLEFRPIK